MIGIYKIENIINNIIYIGSSINVEKRFERHKYDLKRNKHHNIYLQRSYNKYGIENFKFEIIEECNILDIKSIEQKYLDNIFSDKERENKYFNLSMGSLGGDNLTNNPNRLEIIEKIKIGVINRLNNESEEDKLKRIENSKGDKNPNWKGGISTNNCLYCDKIIGYGHTYCIKCVPKGGENNSFYNKKHTQKSKDKIALKRKGIKPKNITPVIINDILYESLKDASDKLNIHVATIRHRVISKNIKFNNYKYPN